MSAEQFENNNTVIVLIIFELLMCKGFASFQTKPLHFGYWRGSLRQYPAVQQGMPQSKIIRSFELF